MNSEKQSTNLQMTLRGVNRVGEGQKNVPKLRFKGYEDAWEQRKLADVSVINPKGEIPTTFKYVDLESVLGTSLLGYKIESKESAPSRAQRVAKKGDIFYQTVRPYQKNNYYFCSEEEDYVFSTGYAQIRPNCSGLFLFTYLQLDGFVLTVLNNCTGTSYPAINSKVLSDLNIRTPQILEQEKIGDIFNSLENIITLHQRKYDALKSMKKTLLSKMFPKNGEDVPEIRFKEFTDAWEQRKLADVSVINPKGEIPTTFKYVDLESVLGTSLLGYKIESKESAPSRAQRVAKKGDIFYQTVRPYQKNNYYFCSEEEDYVFSTGYAQIRPNCSGLFLFTYLQLDGFVLTVLNNCTGTSYPAINSKVLSDLNIRTPQILEQEKIGDIFNSLENIITLHQRKLDELKNMKKTLLQQMFV